MGGRDRCCCDCLVFSDDFNPPCSGSLSSADWDVITGTVTVVDPNADDCATDGQYLSVGAGAVVICKTPAPGLQHFVSIPVGDVSGAKPRIILDADYNPSTGVLGDYKFVEVDGDAGTMKLGYNDGADHYLETISMDYTDGDDLYAYINDSTFSGGWFTDCHSFGTWTCASATNKYTGLGNGGSTAAKFYGGVEGAFTLTQHTDAYDTCGDCDCQCEESCLTRTLDATLTLLSGSACCGDAIIEQEFEFDLTDDDDPCVWEAFTNSYCSTFQQQFKFVRPNTDRKPLCTEFTIHDTGWPGVGTFTLQECSCDPPYWRYTFSVSYGAESCDFQLEIANS